jgi:hypothetical protein
MNEATSSGCGVCGKPGLISWRSEKWGRCAFCIALAIVGTITGWSFTLSFGLISPNKQLVLSLACVSLFFTVVLLLHVVVYLLRRWLTTLSNKSLDASGGRV